jgi:hypothetical protein
MNGYTAVNLIANLILGFSITMFYLYLFTDNSKIIHRWTFINHWILKTGLIVMIIGTLFNVLTFDTPSLSQIGMNIGLALVFVWAYLFHRKLFKTKIN